MGEARQSKANVNNKNALDFFLGVMVRQNSTHVGSRHQTLVVGIATKRLKNFHRESFVLYVPFCGLFRFEMKARSQMKPMARKGRR